MNTATFAVVVAERFPVKIYDAQGVLVHGTAKLFLTRPDENGTGRLLAYSAPDRLLYDVPFYREPSAIGGRSAPWTIETEIGTLSVRSAGGCGCGNRLKGWVPQELQPYRLGRLR